MVINKICSMFSKKGFKLETHMHTSESSLCGIKSAYDMVKNYKDNGYDGVIVTDHFLNGNTVVDLSLPWDKQIDDFYVGYERALKAGRELGVKVFPGVEYNYATTEFIVLGIGKEWFKANEKIMEMTPEEFIPYFRNAGGYVIHAHPFREASYISKHRFYPKLVDAVEVVNLGNRDWEYDRLAYEYAVENKLTFTAGSDAHTFLRYGGAGLILENTPNDVYDIINILRSGAGYSIFGGIANDLSTNQRMQF